MNRSQACSHARTVAGYFVPHVESAKAIQAINAAPGSGGLQRGRDLFAVGVGHEPHRGTDQVHHARLDRGVRPGRRDRLGQAGQPVAAHDEHILDAAISEVRAHPCPELRTLAGLDPDAQHVLDPVNVDPDVGRTIGHMGIITHLDDQRVTAGPPDRKTPTGGTATRSLRQRRLQ